MEIRSFYAGDKLKWRRSASAGADSAAFCDTGSGAALSCAGRGHAKCGFKAKRIVFEIKADRFSDFGKQ
ncbi:MAG: hypothetical protein ABSA70_15205, partial [Terriglobia bacterium]